MIGLIVQMVFIILIILPWIIKSVAGVGCANVSWQRRALVESQVTVRTSK